MTTPRLILLTTLSMLAFAGNSLLVRLALTQTQIDAVSFGTLRILSGALMLGCIVRFLTPQKAASCGKRAGDWLSAFALFAYVASFSLAYLQLSAATGALLLFGAVQVTMISYGLYRGERLNPRQTFGLLLALAGIAALLLPGIDTPPLGAAGFMLLSGVAWAVYSLRGRSATDPLRTTSQNFLYASAFALTLSLVLQENAQIDVAGAAYAIASGALASGVGYALWYAVLPQLKSTSAATIQLSVPPLTACAAAAFLGEPITLRLLIIALIILLGIAFVIRSKAPTK